MATKQRQDEIIRGWTTLSEKTVRRVYQRGLQAFKDEIFLWDCPYKRKSFRDVWFLGWNHAIRDRDVIRQCSPTWLAKAMQTDLLPPHVSWWIIGRLLEILVEDLETRHSCLDSVLRIP